jgi:hypothetical protein
MKKFKEGDFYSTTDSLTANILVYFGFILEGINKNESRFKFIFKKNENLEQVLEDFKKGQLRIEPKKFYFYQRDLKNQIHNN